MNAVGIDVSKGKSMVAVLQPGGKLLARPFEVLHTKSGIQKLISFVHSLGGDTRIVMEHTGRSRRIKPMPRRLRGMLLTTGPICVSIQAWIPHVHS